MPEFNPFDMDFDGDVDGIDFLGFDQIVQQFFEASLRAIVRAEADERVPARFTGTGKAVWDTFRNELTTADLVSLCVQDAGVTMPVPFDPSSWWPDWPARALLRPSEADADNWLVA